MSSKEGDRLRVSGQEVEGEKARTNATVVRKAHVAAIYKNELEKLRLSVSFYACTSSVTEVANGD